MFSTPFPSLHWIEGKGVYYNQIVTVDEHSQFTGGCALIFPTEEGSIRKKR
jgi:hypothetical protein